MATKRRAPKGGGTVFYRHPAGGRKGTWIARHRGRSRQAATREAARALLKQMVEDTQPEPAGELTLADFLTRWTEVNLPRLPIKEKTRQHYHDMLVWYAVPAAQGLLSAFDERAAEEWLDRVQQIKKKDGNKLSTSTVRGVFQAASRALDTAKRDKLIGSNPLRLVERPRSRRKPARVADARAVLNAVEGRRIAPLVTLVAYTGMRINEALSLTWDDVDLDRGTAILRQTKSDRARSVTLVTPVVNGLIAVRERQTAEKEAMGAGWQGGKHIFTSATGSPPDYRSLSRSLTAALEAADLESSRPWHSLRHAAANTLLEAGVPLAQVSRMLGHSSVSITADLYGHVSSALDREQLEKAFKKKG